MPAALAEDVLKKNQIRVYGRSPGNGAHTAPALRIAEGDQKRHEYYRQLAATYEDLYHWENASEELYTHLITNYVNSKSTKEQIHEQAKLYWQQLKGPMQKFDTYRLQFCGRLIEATIYSSINDYRNTIAVLKSPSIFSSLKNISPASPCKRSCIRKWC
ncbi:MAG: hypothetical protein IPN33_23270, partial [Saprospiraceae bacterium]|nr:hypothetical protein [Saprospiraceae bacterium]